MKEGKTFGHLRSRGQQVRKMNGWKPVSHPRLNGPVPTVRWKKKTRGRVWKSFGHPRLRGLLAVRENRRE